MTISDRILGKRNTNGKPHIEAVQPSAALPGGEVRILGHALRPLELRRPRVQFGEVEGSVVISSDDFLIARVPEGATSGPVVVTSNNHLSNPHQVKVAVPIADNLHPVANPALDAEGNIYVTFSGSRGQKVPVAIFKIDTNYNVKPFVAEMMNATSIAFDRDGQMYVSSRHDGTVYRVGANGSISKFAEGMGLATGIAFDREQNLYVGDRSGTVFKIARDRQIFVFATLEPSVSAYHLTFGPGGNLFVTGPTTSSFDSVYRIDPHGSVSTFYRGLGRPQGLAFDVNGNLYVAASLAGKRGIVKLTPDAKPSLEVSGHSVVGLAFGPGRSAVVATNSAIHRLAWDVQGMALPAG
ncbi:MAG TPA: gluconolaconase [Terriglobales bacterium]